MSFSQLRDILQNQPSEQTWNQLKQLFDKWQGDDLELAIEYTIEHTRPWDPKIKQLYLEHDQEVPQWIQLVTNLSYYTTKTKLPSWLQNLTQLTWLNLRDCSSLENVDGLQNLTNLIWLDLSCCDSLENIDALQSLTKLTKLNLTYCRSLKNINGLKNLTNLTWLDLWNCISLKNVDGLQNLNQLTTLELSYCDSLEIKPSKPFMATREEVQQYQELLRRQ